MRCLLALTAAFVLLPLAQLSAQPPGSPREPSAPTVDLLENDHEFIEIEVTIAEWGTPVAEDLPTDEQLQLEGPRDEVAAQIDKLKQARRLTNVHRLRLVAPNRQTAMIQIGMDQPQVTSSQFGPRGTAVNSISYRSVGTLVRATPRTLHENRIAIDLEISKSGMSPSADAPVLAENDSGRQTKAESMRTLTVKTVAAVVSGHTVVVSGSQQPHQGELVLLSARVRKPPQ